MTTNCVFPPELDDKQLLTYLDHPDDHQETASHLEKCSYCREKAEALGRFQKRLTSQLYRITCPSPTELGEFHLRILPAAQMLIINQHLRACPRCAREVAELEEYLRELAQPSDLLEPIRRRIAKLVSGPGMASSPALAGLRGDSDEPFIFEVDQIRIRIDVEDDAEQIGTKSLVGLVTGLESSHFTTQVIQQGHVISTASLDNISNFTISHLAPGIYTLVLIGPNDEIQTESLPIR